MPRVRILIGSATALGPGKVDLLDAIIALGSISAAARTMSMSYRRAWLHVDTMNRSFLEDLVVTATGGRGGGGAVVTAFSHQVLGLYRKMEAKAEASVAKELDGFAALLADHPRGD